MGVFIMSLYMRSAGNRRKAHFTQDIVISGHILMGLYCTLSVHTACDFNNIQMHNMVK